MLIKTEMIQTEVFGINLGDSAQAQEGFWSWFLLVPIIAAATSFLVSFVSMRMNRNRNDAQNDPTAKSMNTMMYMMPLLSLWIGYTMNFGVALYWISSNLFSLLQTLLMPYIVREKKAEALPEGEKKLNYTQIEKMKRDEAVLNGETVEKNKKKKK